MDVESANYLLSLDKYIIEGDKQIKSKQLNLESPLKLRLNLVAQDDPGQVFLVDITESDKKALKISFHHQDDAAQYGLLRVDFYSRHKNPVEILDTVPENFRQFAGIFLDDFAGHIHYVVNGYSSLAWAIPLEHDDFSVKDIENIDDITSVTVMEAFFDKINLKTTLQYNWQMRLL